MLRNPTRSTTCSTNWCGPSVLAVLTGLSYDEAYAKMVAAINRDSRRKARERGYAPDTWVKAAFKGVSLSDLAVAGKSLGVKIEWDRKTHKGTTLLTFTREHTIKGKTYLVCAGSHYVVVQDGVVYDNTKTGPHTIETYPRAKLGRVTGWCIVKPKV